MQAILNTLINVVGRIIFGVIRRNAKAIAAFVVSLVVVLFVNLNVSVSPDVLVALESFIVAVIVWLVPNQG